MGQVPFFFETEGEHSVPLCGQFISNASLSQGTLYALESHYGPVGKKAGGFAPQVAARVVSKDLLNAMNGLSTSLMMSEALTPESKLLREYLGGWSSLTHYGTNYSTGNVV